jgi:hypothetical protein
MFVTAENHRNTLAAFEAKHEVSHVSLVVRALYP